MRLKLLLAFLVIPWLAVSCLADVCVECHSKVTPNIVGDWKLSKHAENDLGCATCHGEGHMTADDADQVQLPTPETCNECHEDQVTQFSKGKHAMSWADIKQMASEMKASH